MSPPQGEVMKNLNLDSCKLSIMDLGKGKRLHINLKRYKKKPIQTQTLYSSIEQGDKAYTEIWLDKQNKKVVGIEIMWDRP